MKLWIRQFLTSAKKINTMFNIFLATLEWPKDLKELNFNHEHRITVRIYQLFFLSREYHKN